MGKIFSKIDEIVRKNHSYLSEDDECYCWGEYTSHQGFEHSEVNDLISNFKKKPEKKNRPEWKYKIDAIKRIALLIKSGIKKDALFQATLVPIPPSKIKSDPEYDDRMTCVLNEVEKILNSEGLNKRLDIRELIIQKKSMLPSHTLDDRHTPNDILKNYKIDKNLVSPEPNTILLFDDVITAGAHFKAAKSILSTNFPSIRIIGVFVARRVFET